MVHPILYLNDAVAIGGGERNLLALLDVLDRSTWRPIVTCPCDGPFPSVLRAMGVQVERVKLPDCRKLKELFRGIVAWIRLNQIVRREQVAIIHANSPPWFPLGCLIARRSKIPSVVSVQGPLEARRVRQFLLHQADLVVPISKHLEALVIGGGVLPERIKLIYSGVDTERFSYGGDIIESKKCLGISANDLVIGCVANLASYKGQDVLVKAFATVLKTIPNAYCLLVGRDDEAYGIEVKSLANRLGLSSRIRFSGFQDNVQPYLEAMDLFVLASRSEGLGIVLLEAMALGKPIVATRVGGIPEIVEDGLTGVLVPPEDPESLAVAIIDVVRNPTKLQAMGRAGKLRAGSFSISETGKTQVKIYKNLLNARN